MKIVCAGGGPAGLYAAILAKLRSSGHEVSVIERSPYATTQGWGVTFADGFLDDLYRCDPVSARELRAASLLWQDQVVRIGDARPVHLGGRYGFSIGRTRMLEILTRRARELGVGVRFEESVEPDALPDADLVVVADGVGSRLRAAHAGYFGTSAVPGRNRYVWLGSTKEFDVFTFAFERTPAGWVWFFGYPSSGEASTCIVECSPRTWQGLGLDTLLPREGVDLLERLFARHLEGHRLLDPVGGYGDDPWRIFRHVRNRTWVRSAPGEPHLALVGDAARTAHFSIGAGTVLAVGDSIALAKRLPTTAASLPAALADYDQARRAQVAPLQETAVTSMTWFEDIDRHLDQDPVKAAYALVDRRGDQASWRYQLHLATQVGGVRQVRRRLTSARRTVRARLRGERLAVG